MSGKPTNMPPALHSISMTGGMLERGFWLYVWRINTPTRRLHYVGTTGDNSSPRASSPFARMGQHLGANPNQNALRRHLDRAGVDPVDCDRFDLIVYGPIYPEIHDDGSDRATLMERHKPFRDRVAAMEMRLARQLREAGYFVLNTVNGSCDLDEDGLARWAEARQGFRKAFPHL